MTRRKLHGSGENRGIFIVRLRPLCCLAATACLLAACGPTPEQLAAAAAAQHASDQNRCFSYGFQPGTDGFAHCMMNTAAQREAQQAAYERMQAAQQAAADRQNAAIQAQKDAAEHDAWDRETHQGAYANSSSNSVPAYSPPQYPTSQPSSNPVDNVRDQIQNDMDKMENAGTVSP
jgi:cell division septum initiation protein DivIVA